MPRKKYRYKNLSFPVADNTDVEFTVQFLSTGDISQTFINIPGDNDPEIQDSGSASLGKGADLREEITVVITDDANAAEEEDQIRVVYKINGQVLVEHTNDRSEEDRPLIILQIKFPAL